MSRTLPYTGTSVPWYANPNLNGQNRAGAYAGEAARNGQKPAAPGWGTLLGGLVTGVGTAVSQGAQAVAQAAKGNPYAVQMPGQTVPTMAAQNYSSNPYALTADEQAYLDATRSTLNSAYSTALANATSQKGSAYERTAAALQQMVRQYRDKRDQTNADLASRGLSLSPAAAGRAMNAIADSQSSDQTQVYNSLGSAIAKIAEALATARDTRDTGLAQLKAQEARWRGDYTRGGL